jgi:pimeloyl-ACP methyl ester carboxylesterase
MDLRGYGDRKQVGGEFTMEEAAADAIALADELGWDRFSVIGHSMGGKVAHQMLLQAPDRVDKLIGLNPVPAAEVPMDARGWELFSGAVGIALLEHPEAQDELRAAPALLPVAADEMLRWWTPVMTFRRTATADCELGGQPIRAGDKVVVSFTSANRDDAVFADPGRFDIRRYPNPHLVFGHGPHFCLGAHLARTQMAPCSPRCWPARPP